MTAIASKPQELSPDRDQCVQLLGIGWKGYTTLLRLRGERRSPKIIYLDGSVWLVSPSMPHERMKVRLGHFVTEVLYGLDIPYFETGQTTFRKHKRLGGLEGDQTFYIANYERVRGKDKLDLRIDPPPDLAIEAVHSHDAKAALEIYRRLKVPEVWVCDEAELRILARRANNRYVEVAVSVALPFLNAQDIYNWIHGPLWNSDLEWTKALRHRVRDTLVPRVRNTVQEPPDAG